MPISELMSWIASLLGLAAFLQQVIPGEYRDYLADSFIQFLSPYSHYIILEYDNGSANDLYSAVQTYLSSLTRQRARVSKLSMAKNAKNLTFSLAGNQRIRDTFEKVSVTWMHNTEERRNPVWMNNFDFEVDERRTFRVKMPRQHKDLILDNYFAYIVKTSKELRRANRDLHLYSNKNKDDRGRKGGGWTCIPFKHPTSFDTVAIDPEQKMSILNDLDSFVNGEDFYRRVGKAWKRGYLLYGPPGTGKTSIVAAMANKLRYDVYDLELTEVESNADLRKLLINTSNKSIIVIEDIDCSLDLSGQRKKKKEKPVDATVPPRQKTEEDKPSRVTLSGLLNFTDGLWSSCGSERIFVFTTNFLKKLDAALLRPGRMDMHIDLGYCRFPAFKVLARNFLQIKDHPRFADVREIIGESLMTPAEVAETLTKDRTDPDLALDLLVKALHDRKNNPPKTEDATNEDDASSEPDDEPKQLVSSDEKTAEQPAS